MNNHNNNIYICWAKAQCKAVQVPMNNVNIQGGYKKVGFQTHNIIMK